MRCYGFELSVTVSWQCLGQHQISNSNSFETMLHQCPTVLNYFQPHCDLTRFSKAATKLYRSINGIIWISVQVHRENEINLNLQVCKCIQVNRNLSTDTEKLMRYLFDIPDICRMKPTTSQVLIEHACISKDHVFRHQMINCN